MPSRLLRAVAPIMLFVVPALAGAQRTAEYRSWNQPVKPFRLIGDIYYVGASDVTSYLIASPRGHILIDGGFEETAPLILANIRALGFKPSDVKILLNSHAHFDHAAGLAELKRMTGATLVASVADSVQLVRGGLGDFTWGDSVGFPPVVVGRTIADGASISAGGLTLVAHLTPGHTRGCTTWTTTVRDGAVDRAVVFLCSVSAPGYQLVGNAAYPNIVNDYRHSFSVLRALPCDVLLAAHGSVFHLKEKMVHAGEQPNPFVDGAECRAYVERSQRDFEKILLEQQQKQQKPQ